MGVSSITDKAAYAISQMLGGAKKTAVPSSSKSVHFPTFFLLTLFILLLRDYVR